MSYNYIICADPEEGAELNSNNVFYANTPNQVEHRINDASIRHPASTICVYKLSKILKLKSKPTYARYLVTPEGEIIPE